MNSKQLLYFVTIVETGSFTAAAQALGLSQPPLSKQLMSLEEELGVTLLSRGSRKAEPTEAGRFLYSRAKTILSMMESAQSQLQGFQHAVGGVLKLGTISSSGHMLTGNFLQQFCRTYPNIHFELTEGNTYELLEQLKNGLIECAILRTPFNSEGFECCYGPEEPLVAAGAPRFFENLSHDGTFTENSPIQLTDLTGKPLIYYRRFESIISVAFQSTGMEPEVFCLNDDARTCLLWAAAGLGIALVPESISRLPLTDKLACHPIRSDATMTRMAAVYKKSGYVSNIAMEFVAYFKAYVADQSPFESDRLL